MPQEPSSRPQPPYWIKFQDPWMQDFYPVLGWVWHPYREIHNSSQHPYWIKIKFPLRGVLRRGSTSGLSRRHLEGRDSSFREYDPLHVRPSQDMRVRPLVYQKQLQCPFVWSFPQDSEEENPPEKIQPKQKKVRLNKFFWTRSVGFLTRVTGKKAKVRANFLNKFV